MICLGLGGFKPILDGYTDAYMVETLPGGVFEMELYYGKSKLQKCVSLFFMEDKYIVMIKVGKKMSWTKQLC